LITHEDLTVLADRIADRIAERLARALGQLFEAEHVPGGATAPIVTSPDDRNGEVALRRDGESPSDLWTVRRVAAHYAVTESFVYQHAEELGCIRLGAGRCARLRFDPEIVRERWATIGTLPVLQPVPRPRRASRRRRSFARAEQTVELLDFDRNP
jgi:hypothetical protein